MILETRNLREAETMMQTTLDMDDCDERPLLNWIIYALVARDRDTTGTELLYLTCSSQSASVRDNAVVCLVLFSSFSQ